jgi:hypothetical protein
VRRRPCGYCGIQCSALIIMGAAAAATGSPSLGGDDAVLHVTQRCRDDPSLHGCRRMAATAEEDTDELYAVADDQLDAATTYMQSLLLLLPPSLVQADGRVLQGDEGGADHAPQRPGDECEGGLPPH